MLSLQLPKTYRGIRVLCWHDNFLYACRRYEVMRMRAGELEWRAVAHFCPPWWRNASSKNKLSYRLFRDGFHALAILPDGTLVATVPGAIVTCPAGMSEFAVTHRIIRGTRPL